MLADARPEHEAVEAAQGSCQRADLARSAEYVRTLLGSDDSRAREAVELFAKAIVSDRGCFSALPAIRHVNDIDPGRHRAT